MKKCLSKLALGSALCASSMAFAAEPVSSVLSDQQMDLVTAAGNGANHSPAPSSSRVITRQTINQTQGDTYNVSISPTIGANVALFNWGNQNVGSYTYQSGGTQSATNK
jgi:hypothetical protein